MATKTTSGSGFLSIFAFSTLDLVDIAPKLKIFKGHFLEKFFGSNFQKFKNYLNELQKLFVCDFLIFSGSYAPLLLCRIWLESVDLFRV